MQGKYFFVVPAVQGKCRGCNIGTSAPLRCSVVLGGAKVGLVPSACPHRAYIMALKSEGSLYPPIPVGGGAVDTNDSRIILQSFLHVVNLAVPHGSAFTLRTVIELSRQSHVSLIFGQQT